MTDERDTLPEDLVSKTLGADLDRIATSRLPGSFFLRRYAFTAESEIRERVREAAKSARPAMDNDQKKSSQTPPSSPKRLTAEEKERLLEEWIQRLVEQARKQGRLMTEQQFTDWNVGRKLRPGDRARYVGPEREERTHSGVRVLRVHGQVGRISSVMSTKGEAAIIVFVPDEAVKPVEPTDAEPHFVHLEVQEGTRGWLTLERIPE